MLDLVLRGVLPGKYGPCRLPLQHPGRFHFHWLQVRENWDGYGVCISPLVGVDFVTLPLTSQVSRFDWNSVPRIVLFSFCLLGLEIRVAIKFKMGLEPGNRHNYCI